MNLKERIWNIHYGQTGLVALVVAFFFTIALPLQTYFGNASMFAYSVGDLLPELLGHFTVLFVGIFVVGVLTAPILGRLFPFVCLVLAIWGYLEVGILSLGFPSLNGETWWFTRPTMRKYIDLLVLVGLACGALLFCKKLFSVLHWLALGLLVMSLAFMADTGTGGKNGKIETTFDKGFCPMYDMVKSVSFSKNRNVLLLSLDSAPADLADEIVKEDPSLRARFEGFTAYAQNIGMHDCTTRGFPALLTGRYVEKSDKEHENNMSFWREGSVLTQYQSAGYNMFVRLAIGQSYTNKRSHFSPSTKPPARYRVLERYSKHSPYLTLQDVLRFRLIPYRYKLKTLNEVIAQGARAAASGSSPDVGREWNLYPILAKASLTEDGVTNCLCVFHSEGVHVPITRDWDGKELPQSGETRANIKGMLHYCLTLVADFLDVLKQRGLYDNSAIVLTTDHGIVKDAKSALLWVKPFKTRAPYAVSNAPTSHARISTLMSALVASDPSVDEITALLSQKQRILRVRIPNPDKWWQFGRRIDTFDFIYDEQGREVSRTCLGEFVIP